MAHGWGKAKSRKLSQQILMQNSVRCPLNVNGQHKRLKSGVKCFRPFGRHEEVEISSGTRLEESVLAGGDQLMLHQMRVHVMVYEGFKYLANHRK